MESSPEVSARRAALEREAPIVPRSVWKRTRLGDKDVVFLCGTIGAEFDAWQRRLSVLSAADALLSQQIGLAAVEKVMDELEERAREEVEGNREQTQAAALARLRRSSARLEPHDPRGT